MAKAVKKVKCKHRPVGIFRKRILLDFEQATSFSVDAAYFIWRCNLCAKALKPKWVNE